MLVGLLGLMFFTQCNNEVDINAPFKDITVVYGVLNEKKDTNYVRIHRAFLGNEGIQGGNQVPDSIYYRNLQVRIEEVQPNGAVVKTTILTRDNNPQPGIKEGFWTTEGFHLYRINEPINQNNFYRIIVEKPDGEGEPATAITPVVGNYNIRVPLPTQRLTFGRNGQNFFWEQARNGRMYQAYLRFHYVQIPRNNPNDSTQEFVDYLLPTQLGTTLSGSNAEADFIRNNVPYATFFRFLQNSIGTTEEFNRFFRGIDLFVVCSADDLTTYINVSQPSTGVVQDKPFFTNINNGAGVFSSMGTVDRQGMELSTISLDSLFNGIYTCGLRFGKQIGVDTCYCFTPGVGGWICE